MNFDSLFLSRKVNYENLSVWSSMLICFLMGSFYVVTLYLWSKQNRYNRNEPAVIIRRFISVLFTCLVCFIVLITIGQTDLNNNNNNKETYHTINRWLGFNFDTNLIKSVFYTLVLTVILFLGPIVQNCLNTYLFNVNFQTYNTDDEDSATFDDKNNNYYKRFGIKKLKSYDEKNNNISKNKSLTRLITRFFNSVQLKINCSALADLCFWRSYVISPFTEEFVFRSCMLPLLMPHFGLNGLILVTPLFFGLAHLHHIVEGVILNEAPLKHLVAEHLFQFIYTYVFGIYSSYLFLRSGNFFSSFVSHSFCNVMGFPNVRQLCAEFDLKYKCFISAVYVVGLITFFSFINTLTTPQYFDNTVFSF